MTATTYNLQQRDDARLDNQPFLSVKRKNLRITTEASQIANACDWLNMLLSAHQVDAILIYQLETVLCEVLNNVVSHAYADKPDKSYIDIHFRVIRQKILLSIDDFGTGFYEPIQLKTGDLYAEEGRGRHIIQSWTDNFRYCSYPTMNRHCLVKYF